MGFFYLFFIFFKFGLASGVNVLDYYMWSVSIKMYEFEWGQLFEAALLPFFFILKCENTNK